MLLSDGSHGARWCIQDQRCGLLRTPIAGMLLRIPFVAALVVARQPRHQLLRFTVTGIGHELVGATTAQRRGDSTVMRDDHVTVLAP